MKSSSIILLAAGPSVKKYDLRDIETRGLLIAINGAALYTKPQIAFSMDRKASEFCYPVWLIQGVPQIYFRACTVKNFKPGKNVTLFQHDGPDTVMTVNPNALNGSNSGICAVNLAYQLAVTKGYTRVFLLGYDMQRGENNEPYWFPSYEWNLKGGVRNGTYAEWAHELNEIARQFTAIGVEVINVNHRSLIKAFPTISYTEFLDLTR